ncbi:MAG: TIGR01906 family membrane protein [Dehalococcoidales bacterium]|nr:TIGR01906 family membrane protein [Dehalococcoidales bacterium]
MHKALSITLKWLLIVTVPFLLLSASIAFWFNFSPLYNYGYQRFDIERVTGIDISELRRATDEIIDFFNATNNEDIDIHVMKNGHEIPLFKEKEINHMRDVRELVRLDYKIMAITFVIDLIIVLLFIIKKQYRHLSQGLIGSGIFTFAFVAIIGIVMLIDFDDLFILFHYISFDNMDWLLDPTTDYLVMMYPDGFWFMALGAVIILLFLEVAIVMAAGFVMKKKLPAETLSELSQ